MHRIHSANPATCGTVEKGVKLTSKVVSWTRHEDGTYSLREGHKFLEMFSGAQHVDVAFAGTSNPFELSTNVAKLSVNLAVLFETGLSDTPAESLPALQRDIRRHTKTAVTNGLGERLLVHGDADL